MEAIKSRSNPAVKFARRLHKKKYRDQESLFIMEGERCLQEVVRLGLPIHTLYYSRGIKEKSRQIQVELLSIRAEHIFVVEDEIMEYISPAKSSQKILAVLPQQDKNLSRITEDGRYFIGLYRISDPGNLGTIIRSAKAFECGGIFLIDDCVDVYNPKTVRSSAGYVVSIPVIKLPDMESFLELCMDRNFISIALSAGGETPFFPVTLKGKTVYVMGGEAFGLEEFEERFQDVHRIDMNEKVESLNLGVATSIVMEKVFETVIRAPKEKEGDENNVMGNGLGGVFY